MIDALLSSSKEFWTKMGYSPNEERNRLVANIMIPFMGVVFMAAGIASVAKVVIHFTRQ